jgi:hypothetical protein
MFSRSNDACVGSGSELQGRASRCEAGSFRRARAKRRWAALFGWCLCLASLHVLAAPTTYSGEAPVASQSEGERAAALKSALADVVIRLSGDTGILARDDVARAVAEADKYVLQYRYRRDVGVDEISGSAIEKRVLVAEFDSRAVDRMLAGLGMGPAQAAAPDVAPSERRIWVSGIYSASDYARGMGYLARQAQVRQSWPMEARADGVLVRLTVAGDLLNWLEIVENEGVLRVNSASPPLDGIDATLSLIP